jgi:hypothetical protein
MITEVGKLGTATFSDDRRYRYSLDRHCGNTAPAWWVTFVMLNPSIADHDQNDRTVAKCLKYAARFCDGWSGPLELLGVRVVNLFAFRATKPRDCFAASRPIGGAENDRAIVEACTGAALVVCAWGSHVKALGRASEVRQLLQQHEMKLHRLGPPTKIGQPQHPLYLKDELPLEAWT